ncbi:MAG: radical SAM protein [Vicinamibacterales bacterium]
MSTEALPRDSSDGAGPDASGLRPEPSTRLRLAEFHPFEASGQRFAYMVPSAAVFALDDCATAIEGVLRDGPRSISEIVSALDGSFTAAEVWDSLGEMYRVHAVAEAAAAKTTPKVVPLTVIPLQTLVVNVTNQCNLSCEYCYECGEDKIVDTENGQQPKFMSEETARQAVEFALRESGHAAMVTFFGGETLMNFPVLRKTVTYARQRAAELGKEIDFSLTTNATLLKPDVIDFLADERIGVTISIDGPQEIQDKFRVFTNGKGSYELVAPKIKALLARHRSRPIGARVTLTRQTLDVTRIYKHLHDEMGFWEVGFAPVTTAPQRGHAISDGGFDHLLSQFRALAADFLQASLENRHHGFSNVRETLQELHQGHAKAYCVRRRHRTHGSRDRRQRVAVPPLRGFGRASLRLDHRGRRSGEAGGVPRRTPHQSQDGLPVVLGAAHLRRRLLSRGPHALRHDHGAQPALLRVDSRLDTHVPGNLRRAGPEEPGVPPPVRWSRR